MDYIKDVDGSGNWPASQSSGTFATALGTIDSSGGFKFLEMVERDGETRPVV